jgi:hypothetical protein
MAKTTYESKGYGRRVTIELRQREASGLDTALNDAVITAELIGSLDRQIKVVTIPEAEALRSRLLTNGYQEI